MISDNSQTVVGHTYTHVQFQGFNCRASYAAHGPSKYFAMSLFEKKFTNLLIGKWENEMPRGKSKSPGRISDTNTLKSTSREERKMCSVGKLSIKVVSSRSSE